MEVDIYRVEGERARLSVTTDLETAENLLQIAKGQIAWALEEYGRCDGEGYIAVPSGDPAPMNPI